MPNAILVPVDELEKLRADASRYRWLNKNDNLLIHIENVDFRKQRVLLKCGEPLDNWIDRQMSSEPDDDPDYRKQDRRNTEYDAEELLDNIARAKDQNKGY